MTTTKQPDLFPGGPNIQPLVTMILAQLGTITEAITDGDGTLPKQCAKYARKTKALAVLLVEEVNQVLEAQKATTVKKK